MVFSFRCKKGMWCITEKTFDGWQLFFEFCGGANCLENNIRYANT